MCWGGLRMKKEDARLLLAKASEVILELAKRVKKGDRIGDIEYQRELLYMVLLHIADSYNGFPFPEKSGDVNSLFVFLPGNVPVVPLQVLPISIVYNLKIFFKLPHNEQLFFHNFRKLLSNQLDFIDGNYLSHDEALRRAGEYDFVFIFGGKTAYRIAEKLNKPVRIFGPRFSIGYINKLDLTEEIAKKIAFDNLAFDTAGCLSLRFLFVQGRADISIFREAFKYISSRLQPQSNFDRDIFEYGTSVILMDSEQFIRGADWMVSKVKDIPTFWPPRTLFVMEVNSPEDALAILGDLRYNLQGAALGKMELKKYFNDTSVSYFSEFGKLQFPPSGWMFEKGVNINNILKGVKDV